MPSRPGNENHRMSSHRGKQSGKLGKNVSIEPWSSSSRCLLMPYKTCPCAHWPTHTHQQDPNWSKPHAGVPAGLSSPEKTVAWYPAGNASVSSPPQSPCPSSFIPAQLSPGAVSQMTFGLWGQKPQEPEERRQPEQFLLSSSFSEPTPEHRRHVSVDS